MPGARADSNPLTSDALGPPSLAIAEGTTIVGNGVGLVQVPGNIPPYVIVFDVPAGATVKQVLFYWNGFHSTPGNGDDTLWLDTGSGCDPGMSLGAPVVGTLIGGPRLFFANNYSSTYRADITGLGLVTTGTNMIEVCGSDFDKANNGATIMAIIDDPAADTSSIQIADGQDLAFVDFAPPLDTTVAQLFEFAPSDFDRFADLTLLAGSVQGPISGADPSRPNLVVLTLDGSSPGAVDCISPGAGVDNDGSCDGELGGTAIPGGMTACCIVDAFASINGPEWDHVEESVLIPAGVDSMTIQAFSVEDGTGNLPASLAWLASALAVPEFCEISIDKQISCDAGVTWVDIGSGPVVESCKGWDGEAEIQVRYIAETHAIAQLYNCELTDSNGHILPMTQYPLGGTGIMPQDLPPTLIYQTNLLECNGDLDALEPNLATLTCECYEDGSGQFVTSTDEAEIECEVPGVMIEKDCGPQDPDLINPISITVTNPPHPRGAELTNCIVTDPLAGFTSAPFGLVPGEAAVFDISVAGIVSTTLNEAFVICNIVGAPPEKTVQAGAEDICYPRTCDIDIDKQISCDGGNSWTGVDAGGGIAGTCTGWDDPANPEVKVRYLASSADANMVNCELFDSNGEVLPGPVLVGDLPGNSSDLLVWETDLLNCSEELEAGEPNTATLVCECYYEGSGQERIAQDQEDIDCKAVNLEIEKTCDALDPAVPEHDIVITVTNPPDPRGATLGNCVVTDPLAGFTSPPFLLAPGDSREFNTSVFGLTEDTLNEAFVTCSIVGAPPDKSVTRQAEDVCVVPPCVVELDKQVSCDGGASWTQFSPGGGVVDTCIGWDDPANPEVKVRYVATSGSVNLVNCELTDSNGEVLPMPVDTADLPAGTSDVVVWETDLLNCSELLEAGEPNTATLTCECYDDGSDKFTSDQDQANIECQEADLQINKVCEDQDPASGENPVTITVANPDNPRGAALTNCVVTDPLAGFTSAPFSLAPGDIEVFDISVSGLTEPTLNTASVVCNIVGAPPHKTIERQTEDECFVDCSVNVDKQVSCDGGITWVGMTPGGGVVESCIGWDDPANPEVKVRYVADAGIADLFGCVLTDSNGVVLAGSVDVGPLPSGTSGQVIYETDLLNCSEELEAGEPNTATLTCECFNEGNDQTVTDQDQANIECAEPNLEIEKVCGEQDLAGENPIAITVTNPENPRGATLANCVVTDPLAGYTSAPFNLVPGQSEVFNISVSGLEEPTLNEAFVVCNIVGAPPHKTIERRAEDECTVVPCDVAVDKQVSCDGGVTWSGADPGGGIVDTCIGWDDPANPEVKVRYLATAGDANLFSCELIDSNGEVIAGPVGVGGLPGGTTGQLIYETDLLNCSEELEAGEPNTATLVCECFREGSQRTVMDQDRANIECLEPALEIDKTCDEQDLAGENGITITVTNPDNPRGASLANCVVTDPLAGFTSDPFSLNPGESQMFNISVSDLTERTLNEAYVVCDVVGAAGKQIEAMDEDYCDVVECGVSVDKQISCDGGLTWVDVGYGLPVVEDSCTADGGAPVLVRYAARNDSYRSSGAPATLSNCTLTDSNGLILAGPVNVGDIADGFDGIIYEVDPKECTSDLEAGEPDTVTLTCECFEACGGTTATNGNLMPYSQDFEGLDQADPGALGNDGWLVFGNVFTPDWGYLYGYGPFPAPNGGPGFSAIASGEGGPPQGAQQLSVYNDYNNGDHGNGNLVEANVFQERTINAADVGSTWLFEFDAKRGNLEGDTTALAFFKTLDPNNGYALTNFITIDMTSIPTTWGSYSLSIFIDPTLDGQILQFGFASTATGYQGAGIFYDNVNFRTAPDCPIVTVTDEDTAAFECLDECELSVLKTCYVPPQGDDDDDDDDCNGKVLGMKLQYTGEGCDATTNPQEGKAGCEGGAGMAEPIHALVIDDRGSKVYGEGPLFLGDIIEATAANAGEDKFGAQTDIFIDDDLEQITFHTSCSKPLSVGDQFGSMLLVELTTTEGGVVTLPPPMPIPPAKECFIPAIPPGPHCEGGLSTLALRYIGGDCDQTTQDQEGKFICNGDADAFEPVRIKCYKDSKVFLDTGVPANVYLNDVVELQAANAGESKLPSQTACQIYDEFGNWVQDLSMHTSCSKRIDLGDIFGAVEVYGLGFEGGGYVAQASEVIYTYEVSNPGAVAAIDVQVVDDQLGVVPGSPIPWLGPGDSVTLHVSTLVDQDTINTVTVTGYTEGGGVCEDQDSAIVIVDETPPVVECTTKVQSMLLTYIGPDLPGPVTVEVAGDKFRNDPAVYQFPGGLTTGTQLSSPAENGFTLDPTVRGLVELGSKSYLVINGVEEVIHTSCSTPFLSGMPAPLDNPKGDPSPNWFVDSFTQK